MTLTTITLQRTRLEIPAGCTLAGAHGFAGKKRANPYLPHAWRQRQLYRMKASLEDGSVISCCFTH